MEELNWNPGTLMGMSGFYWKTCTLHAAVKLDIFSIVGKERMSAEKINTRLKGDLRGLVILLNGLAALNLLKKDGDAYANTQASLLYLCKFSDSYVGYMIMHHFHLVDSWHRMDQAVLRGGPVRNRSPFSDEERRESFLMGMFNIAMGTAPDVAGQIDLSGCTRLLDFGGGPGTFAIHFCLANSLLTAAVYDLETTRPFAENTIERFGLSDRIRFIAGNYIEEDMAEKGAFDAAWLSHILHAEGPDQAEQIVQKAVDALMPGSPIFIHEFILDDTMDGPVFPALFSMNMFLGTSRGRSYTQSQLSDILSRCGVTRIRRHDFVGPTQSGILSGLKA